MKVLTKWLVLVVVLSFWNKAYCSTNTFIVLDELNDSSTRKYVYQADAERWVKKVYGEKALIKSVDLVAWCIKQINSNLPPWVVEESVWMIHLEGNEKLWILVYVFRELNGPWKDDLDWRWKLYMTDTKWITESREKPGDEELSKFISDTWFGNNEWSPYLEVIRVGAFNKYKAIFPLLQNGIPKDEGKRRYYEYERRIKE